tara:strand:+ start:482 stop:961 length:480 start_codon:yes stop_codon:yes gene_type:complete
MKLVIRTQHEENYGAHNWDGEGECPQRWKFKFGGTYVVENATFSPDALADFLDTYINESNEGWKEYAISTTLMDDDDDIGIPDWETPIIIRASRGSFFAYVDTPAQGYWEQGFKSKHESWIMWDRSVQPGGRSDYVVEWTTDDGRRGNYLTLKGQDDGW